MRVACVGIVGKDNDPLVLRVFRDGLALDALDLQADGEKDGALLRYHYAVHSSLDIVEERHKQPGQNTAPTTPNVRWWKLGPSLCISPLALTLARN